MFGKLGFIHRLLWGRDGLYRAALLVGPAPLVGCALAVAIWAGFQSVTRSSVQTPPWAVVHSATLPPASGSEARVVPPARPLPEVKPDGSYTGYQLGWIVTAHPVQVTATLDATIERTTLNNFAVFSVIGSDIDMARIAAAGPKDTVYAGLGSGFLVAREHGIYALTARFDRPAGPPATCLIRLGFGGGLVVANLELDLINSTTKSFGIDRFDLQPGLYPISWAFGCWHGHEMTGPGRMTVLLAHPGEASPQPARADDIVE